MKIVRLLTLACALCLLAACSSESVTGPDPDRVDAPRHETVGGGLFGSGN